jgi:hypothetical protein
VSAEQTDETSTARSTPTCFVHAAAVAVAPGTGAGAARARIGIGARTQVVRIRIAARRVNPEHVATAGNREQQSERDGRSTTESARCKLEGQAHYDLERCRRSARTLNHPPQKAYRPRSTLYSEPPNSRARIVAVSGGRR